VYEEEEEEEGRRRCKLRDVSLGNGVLGS